MGWLRLVGSLKLQVSFAEYRLFYRALLQKRPLFLRSLPIVATPYALIRLLRKWYLCVSHDVCEGVMSHIWMSHVTYMDESCRPYKRVMSHIWMSHVTHMSESHLTYWRVMSHIWISHTYEWVTSHVLTSHVTVDTWSIYEWVMSHICTSHVTHMNESHTWMSHVSRTNESCHGWHMIYTWMSYVTHMNESWQTYHFTHMNE